MQEEAVKRVREMQQRSRSIVNGNKRSPEKKSLRPLFPIRLRKMPILLPRSVPILFRDFWEGFWEAKAQFPERVSFLI